MNRNHPVSSPVNHPGVNHRTTGRRGRFGSALVLLLVATLFTPLTTLAEPSPTSDLLLPYFEVDLTGFKLTTLFQITNSGAEEVDVRMTVHTNWGIPMEEVLVTLESRQTRAFNLRDWLFLGELPQKDGTLAALSPRRLSHVQSAMVGQQSPEDQLYYATEVVPDRAVGYVTIRATGPNRDDVLWGNYFVIDPQSDSAQADVLVDIDRAHECHDLCSRHLLFFLEGGGFDGGTEVILWNEGSTQPSPIADAVEVAGLKTDIFNLDGALIGSNNEGLMATQTMTLEQIIALEQAGSLEMVTTEDNSDKPIDSFIGIRYSAENRYSVAMQAWCQPFTVELPETPRISIQKSTNGDDADISNGPTLEVGDAILWEYVVTNTGTVPLTDIVVTDDQGVLVSCPDTALDPGDFMTCTGSGTAACEGPGFNAEGVYENIGEVSAQAADGTVVTDEDPSHYTCDPGEPTEPAIDIEKSTNGQDADTPTGPEITVGDTVTWTYVVTNTGTENLVAVQVVDNQEGGISCPKTTLAVGESMTCTLNGIAQEGQYANIGTADADSAVDGQPVTDSDPSHYLGVLDTAPAIDIEKATNGHDADTPTGPEITVGDTVTWTYVVTNTGTENLVAVQVVDNQEGGVSCPKTTLAVGESMTCTLNGIAQEGQYANIGTADADSAVDGQPVTDSDPSHHFGVLDTAPAIDIEKATNGHDADIPTGPEITVGDTVTWTYVVTNTGTENLVAVQVVDNQEGGISCPKTTLAVGESMTCTLNGIAQEGQYANIGTADADSAVDGQPVSDSDPSHYFGVSEPPSGDQGCTPGYWKNHADSWPATGISTAQSVDSVFSAASAYPTFGSTSMIGGLSFKGGSGVEGGVGNLLRAAIASVLDASHPGVDYPRSPSSVIGSVNAALASGDRATMLSLAASLDQDNNLGCPLN